jgi:hypothetical protein
MGKDTTFLSQIMGKEVKICCKSWASGRNYVSNHGQNASKVSQSQFFDAIATHFLWNSVMMLQRKTLVIFWHSE